jgi:hypothetical protein
MVEVLRGQLVRAAGCASAWHSVGDDSAGVDSLFGLLSHVVVVGVLYRVRLFLFIGLFVWWCVLQPVMYLFLLI